MKNLLYDYYGIYVDKINDGYFIYQNHRYLLIQCSLSNQEILNTNYIYQLLFSRFNQVPYFLLIENKYHQVKTLNYVLYQLSFESIALEDLIHIHSQPLQASKKEQMIKEWISIIDQVENEVLPNIKETLSFDYAYALITYALGLAENALGYLQDQSFKNQIYFSSWQIDPFQVLTQTDLIPTNYYFEHYLDYLVNLYQGGFISIEMMNFYLKGLNEQEYSYIYARLLFPKSYFNCLLNQKDKKIILQRSIHFYKNIEIYENRIQRFYHLISQKIKIRPLEWLESS